MTWWRRLWARWDDVYLDDWTERRADRAVLAHRRAAGVLFERVYPWSQAYRKVAPDKPMVFHRDAFVMVFPSKLAVTNTTAHTLAVTEPIISSATDSFTRRAMGTTGICSHRTLNK